MPCFLDVRKGVADCQRKTHAIVSRLTPPERRLSTGWRMQREMSIKSDRWIREQAQEHGMIAPFSEKQVREGVISYGLSSYGYDLRVSDEFKDFYEC